MGTVKPLENEIDALDLLTEQHDKVEALIKSLETA